MESFVDKYISKDEKILARVHFSESKFISQAPTKDYASTSPYSRTVVDVGFYATNKRLIRIEFETMPDFRELPYSMIKKIVLVKEKKLFRKREYYQIEGNLGDDERKLWRFPANAKNAEEFCRVVNDIVKRRRWE